MVCPNANSDIRLRTKLAGRLVMGLEYQFSSEALVDSETHYVTVKHIML